MLLLALVLLPGLACDGNRGRHGRASDEWTRSYHLAPGGELQIVGGVGNIDVTASEGERVEIRADRIIHASTDAMAAPMVEHVRITEEISPDKVLVRSEGLGGVIVGADVEVVFHLTVPRGTRLRLHAASGSITASGLSNTLVASTTNGTIRVSGITGGVEARAANGNISADIAAVGPQPVELRSVNGGVDLRLPASADADVQASCANGAISIDGLPIEPLGEQSPRRQRVRLNAGGSPMDIVVTNGNIRIRPLP